MFKFLQKILGKTSSSYEALMRSKAEQSEITETQIEEAITLMQPLVRHAKSLTFTDGGVKELPQSNLKTWPVNNKGYALPYYGAIVTAAYYVNIFVDEEKLLKDDSNYCVEIIPHVEFPMAKELETTDASLLHNKNWTYNDTLSIPIWEEIIHRDLTIHKKLVALAPTNPWTLYKKLKAKITTSAAIDTIDGFPQWIENDQDFRQFKGAKFAFSLSLAGGRLKYFTFVKEKEILTILQRNR